MIELGPRGISIPDCEAKKDHPIKGIASIIIHAETGKLRVVQEKKNKPQSGRTVGDWTIALETYKVGETRFDALKGAMAEMFDDFDMDRNNIRGDLTRDIIHMQGNSFYNVRALYGGRTFDIDYALLLYLGKLNLKVNPYNSEEVGNPKWEDPSYFSRRDIPIRPFARLVISGMYLTGAYDANLSRFDKYPDQRLQVFDPGFSIRETYGRRELLPDMR